MKHLIMLTALLLPTFTQAGELKLDLVAAGLQDKMLFVAIYPSSARFMTHDDKAIYRRIVATGDTTTLQVAEIPPGMYAITVYADLNGNGKLDSNLLGIPKEPTGFSRDASSRFGPPKFKEAAFDIGEDVTSHTIHLQ